MQWYPNLRVRTLTVTAFLGLLLAGCATPPEKLRGEFPDLAPDEVDAEDTGTTVRWGGAVLEVDPEADRTCIQILGQPLDSRGRPRENAAGGHRFLACRDSFIEPAAYPEGRSLTVIGTLSGFEQRPVGEYDYRFPVITLDSIHLWPKALATRYRPSYYGSFGYFGHSRHRYYFNPRFYHEGSRQQ